ncbi:MAG: N-acetylglucosamine kinase [Bacilli bacterium]|nr:N-acetylglucosamine kinase [Bacilli bacterium]MDD4076385.1 BadF/BadG/BcrA/BcrD ATPase family protein [Bacilli bacterium]MDD4388963.1 BadF/BadG/BcrA/BcrD ATPase family protein [Bacilli bacterium]
MEKLILGVDGGNTKTDYFLFTSKGAFIDFYHGPTCSHEQFKDSYQGAYWAMKKGVEHLFKKHKLQPNDILASVFGLAGVDTPKQKTNIEKVVADIGFKNFKVVNDSFLGIKAITEKGYGVCSINGTGTSCGAIDKHGNYLQVGGIGWIVGDDAGGGYIARLAVRAVYNTAYRFGKPTSLYNIVMGMLGVSDKYFLMEAISDFIVMRRFDYMGLTLAVFSEANKGDEVAIEILESVGISCSKSAAGAIVNLDFDSPVDVVLAGSVWVKGASPVMIKAFSDALTKYSGKECRILMLNVPPATGAVIWALELAAGAFPDLEKRQEIIETVSKHLTAAGVE